MAAMAAILQVLRCSFVVVTSGLGTRIVKWISRLGFNSLVDCGVAKAYFDQLPPQLHFCYFTRLKDKWKELSEI
jgi:hypothetical protein